jgi:hypothetical protein
MQRYGAPGKPAKRIDGLQVFNVGMRFCADN